LFFWIGVVTACGVGAATLQVLGPLPAQPTAEKRYPSDPAAVQLASLVPLTPSPIAEPPNSAVEASASDDEPPARAAELNPPVFKQDVTASEEAASEPAAPPDHAAPSPDPEATAPSAAPPTDVTRMAGATAAEPRTTRRDTAAKGAKEPRERKVQLRLVRDSSSCPRPDCSRWQVIGDAMGAPRSGTVDLARLRLAPSLQDAADNGEVEVMIEAVERRRKVNGRNIVVSNRSASPA